MSDQREREARVIDGRLPLALIPSSSLRQRLKEPDTEAGMKSTRPTGPMAFDLVAYGIVLLGILIAAAFSRTFGW